MSGIDRRDTHARCMAPMSTIYRKTKHKGCKWYGGPEEFIEKNCAFIGLRQPFTRPYDYEQCELILKDGVNRLSREKPPKRIPRSKSKKCKFPKPTWSKKSVPDYGKLREYLATPDGALKWQQVRFEALRASNGVCCLCGATPSSGTTMHVDHIKPKSLYPELVFEPSNLQVLCAECNMGKGNRSEDDFRRTK